MAMVVVMLVIVPVLTVALMIHNGNDSSNGSDSASVTVALMVHNGNGSGNGSDSASVNSSVSGT